MASTKSQDSTVQERTVSVLPSRKSRVMDASYVRQNLPMSWERKGISIQGTRRTQTPEPGWLGAARERGRGGQLQVLAIVSFHAGYAADGDAGSFRKAGSPFPCT